MAGTRTTASFYTVPCFLNPTATATTPQGEVFNIGAIDTVKLFFGGHSNPCYGGPNCDSNWREENTRHIKELLSPHRSRHVARGGNPMKEFPLTLDLIDDLDSFQKALHILYQKERDWMSIHPNAEPYPHTTSLMYDTRQEGLFMAQHPNVRPRPRN